MRATDSVAEEEEEVDEVRAVCQGSQVSLIRSSSIQPDTQIRRWILGYVGIDGEGMGGMGGGGFGASWKTA